MPINKYVQKAYNFTSLKGSFLASRVQWYKEPQFIDPFERLACLASSGSGGQLPIFVLPAPGIEPRPHAWVESALTTGPCCPPYGGGGGGVPLGPQPRAENIEGSPIFIRQGILQRGEFQTTVYFILITINFRDL